VIEVFKVTGTNGSAHHGGFGKWTKNRWRSVSGEVVPCENGLHLCRRQDLIDWLGPVIWRAEYDGELIEQADKVVARRARVVERIDNWNERTARLFAADCAERVLPIFEEAVPGDGRPRKAIKAARAYANGEIAAAARDAARAAAWDAAWAAAWDAAWDAARDAAWAAARDAAWAAARDAARDAARAAAWAAARAAARDAARDEFREWAAARLFDYLEGRAA
jgi:hypothetical protein